MKLAILSKFRGSAGDAGRAHGLRRLYVNLLEDILAVGAS
jgi:hypothetical protein